MAGAAVEVGATNRPEAGVNAWPRLWFALVSVAVLTLGWLEGWYGKTSAGDVYGSDAVQYLDIARAFERGDLHSALNPLWSQGYPALFALIRPLFRAGGDGEWNAIRSLNFAIFVFSWLCFAALLGELLRGRRRPPIAVCGAIFAFVTAQLCMDQVSRVGPDQLVAAIFFLACTLLLRMLRAPSFGVAAALGFVLGLGFLVKSIFLPLGCVALAIAAIGLIRGRQKLRLILPAVALFAAIVLSYGAALSRAFGSPTLGEAGSLNYAWHVDRLAKWVHWEGGVDPADKAWPKPWIARFARWDSDPPDFGRPVHPSQMVGSAPAMYVFHAPVQATYAPYFDPPYFYQGYRHPLRWRYEVVALGKNLGDLALVLAGQPFFWALGLAFLLTLWQRGAIARISAELPAWYSKVWPAIVLPLAGVAIYLPVHLEGRYLAAFLAVIVVLKLDGQSPALAAAPLRRRLIVAVLTLGFLTGLVKAQRVVWSRALDLWSYHDIPEWREGQALRAEGLPLGSQVGVISWTPNVQCDWAYLAEVRITSEIESGPDERAFWGLAPEAQTAVLQRFHDAGAVAVLTRDKPPENAAGWRQLGAVPMWSYRFRGAKQDGR